jgi:hypothetical protein
MQRNTLWTLAAVATVAGALATLPAGDVAAGGTTNTTTVGPSYRCYPASALKGATGNLPVHLTGEDEVGPFNVTLTKAKSLCIGARIDDAVNSTAVVVNPVVCFATKDLVRPSTFPKGIVINLTVAHVGDLSLKLKPSKLTCLPLTQQRK